MEKKSVVQFLVLLALFSLSASFLFSQDPPPLPSGLGGSSESPALPSGLGGLPKANSQFEEETENDIWELHGFVETRVGLRLKDAPSLSDATLAEARLQLKFEEEVGAALLEGSFDFLYDNEATRRDFDWEKGNGWFDARTLSLEFQASDNVDVKLGRQIATWGVGDLLFINDLFPKDWNAFFLGRDVEYLKAPQDSARFSIYNDFADLDIVYSPRFEPDRFIDGNRLVYWDDAVGSLTRGPSPLSVQLPGDTFNSDELHLRASRMLGRYESALYGYWGYWKSPAGADTVTGDSIFPALNVFGASLRGPLGEGILSAEIGFYESDDDPDGSNPFVRNSETRLLLGYEQELGNELTGSLQYYLERTRDYSAAMTSADRNRDLITLRLRKQLWRQTLTLNGFVFYSPSQEDHYTRLSASWKASDEWRWDVGANLFGGARNSFFGQFGRNDNVYLSARRLF